MKVKPDADVAERLEEEVGDDGEEGDEGEQVPAGLLLDQGVVRPAVADHDDGHGCQADVHDQVLVVAGFSSDLWDHIETSIL